MGIRNYLVEGVSCAGKTSVCDELLRRGLHAIHGDRELAFWGDPQTGSPSEGATAKKWIWDPQKVRSIIADETHLVTFFCGGSRNHEQFVDLLDGVFVLEIDLETLNRRLAARPADEWGGSVSEGVAYARLQHATREGIPSSGVSIDATADLTHVVDQILGSCDWAAPD